jgi:hypothetical protein
VGHIVTDVDGILKYILQRVFWCFAQSTEAFKHCRPLVVVDGTFLIGKYKGVLMEWTQTINLSLSIRFG